MASYEIEISRTAEKQLRRLPREDQERVARAMVALGHEPLPRGSRKLSGYDDVYRIRAGGYRILYSVASERLVIVSQSRSPPRRLSPNLTNSGAAGRGSRPKARAAEASNASGTNALLQEREVGGREALGRDENPRVER